MWVEFVVGSQLCSERFLSGYSGFLLSSETNISKFQFDLDYCQTLYHEPLARVIVQALPVFDIKFKCKRLKALFATRNFAVFETDLSLNITPKDILSCYNAKFHECLQLEKNNTKLALHVN